MIMSNYAFHQEVAVSSVAAFPSNSQINANFRGQANLILICTAGSVDISFDSTGTVHAKMDAANQSAKLEYGLCSFSRIWVKGTSGTVRAYIWK
jgi:hypothetical protein